VVKHAVKFIRGAQRPDGGFGQYPGSSSNAQSTAWAVQGVVAAGRDPQSLRHGGHTPLGYLKSLARGDGSIRYSKSSAQTPVWVTAQALTALERKPFPLTAVKAVHAGTGAGGDRGAKGAHGSKHRRGAGAGAAGSAAGHGGVTQVAPGGSGARALRRASQRVGAASGSAPSPATILLLSGAGLLLLAGGAGWRYRRLVRRIGAPPLP
jgi:hypothetical protein